MARAPKITFDRLESLIQDGHGTGHGENYKPMLEIKRWNPSPVSTQVLDRVPPFERPCHFFSRSEWLLALLFSWAGAQVREQYPLWPWSHQHPLYGLESERDTSLPWSAGMMEICWEYGIKHGNFPGTKIPYIWTMDLVLTLPWVANDQNACCLVSVKPLGAERYLYIDPLDRGPEKLEAERQYALSLGVPYFVGDRSLYPGDLFGQLEWLAKAADLPENSPNHIRLERFLDQYAGEASDLPLLESRHRLEKDFDATTNEAKYLVQHCLWHQHIDCDLSRDIDMRVSPRPGGRALQAALRQMLTKGDE